MITVYDIRNKAILYTDVMKPVFALEGNELYLDPHLARRMVDNKYPVATWGGTHSAVIDGPAYHILSEYCAGNREKLEIYLAAITDFSIKYSDDPERHKNRTPVELEILGILKQGGYFD